MKIEPKLTAATPSTPEAVAMVAPVDCASAKRTSEARVESEWRVGGLEPPGGRGVKHTRWPT